MADKKMIEKVIEEDIITPEGYEYLRTDRNGTRLFVTHNCPKCGGKGLIDHYSHVDRGVCFKCGGSGKVERGRTLKIMTPEYQAKLNAKKEEKMKADAPNRLAEFLKANGFTANGYKYVVLGETFSRKDDLKADEAKFDGLIKRWYFDKAEVEGYSLSPVKYDEMYFLDDYGVPFAPGEYTTVIDRLKKVDTGLVKKDTDLIKKDSASEHIGEEGQKVELELTLVRICQFETHFTYSGKTCYIYRFEDKDGNVVTWKTSCKLDVNENQKVVLKGTIKKHGEYKGVKQTVLTRCKIIK